MRSGSAWVRHLSGFGSFHFITNCSMKSYKLSDLTRAEVDELEARPRIDFTSIFNVVQPIVDDVRSTADKAVKDYTLRFDKVELDKIVERVNDLPDSVLDPAVQEAFDVAYNNIFAFHAAQKPTVKIVENMEGVRCKRVARNISAVGLYVPGGTAVLPSTALMLSVPAQIAGCKTIVLATPPSQDGSISKEVLYHAKAGIARILEAGGAQAILAAPWGTESCPKGVRCKKEAESISTMDFSVPVGMELLLSSAMAGLHSTFIELVPVGMKLLLSTAMAGLLSTFIEHVNAFSVERKIENRREPRLLVLPCPWDSLWDFLSGGRKEKKARILLFEIVPRPSLGPLVHTIQPFPFICPHCTEYLYKWPLDHIRNCNGGEAGSNFEAVWESIYHRINMDPVDCRICPICKRRLQMEDNNVQIHIAECQERRRRVGTTAALPGQNFCGAVRKFFSGGYTSQSTSSSFS